MTAIEIKNGLHDMQATLNRAIALIDDDMPIDEAMRLAEAARIDADRAFRAAIGASCDECGSAGEWAVGLG